ncbi:ABC-type dipeptide/oligopeptide/nickel transport system ATPase subunit [Paraburkholderia atlantica]|uniref:Peptide/nickel transport system ATP-binding protein n=2 Tax=Paraburkholderia TaxID=1822464 RepID=A0A7W8LFA0_9BURK|nr:MULTISPECIES: ATP-binding cassette domain-containing protein [Paraburkholderia]MBB5405936.1 peptide/nickel transport system ATP-binding protein [Paraburkholderia youngii]MBB5421234.1 peptide/nickel transport system ATP-binding protein [Paraburkholderia atlantica]MBB5429235.1 peptide/nickel transport system ATP-binding protein [Paraburkholderia atlantica]
MPPVRVLDYINLVLRRGNTLGVICESGSGKSTLAYVIAGLLAPAQGEIRFAGKFAERERDLYRRIKLAFQNADKVLLASCRADRSGA